jgi:acetylornithine aminotransferase/acetylornithine/N-succinyldiaminopimelate aminotransferase
LQFKHDSIREVRGLGLMLGMELESADLAKTIFKQMLERGVVLNRTDETVLRFLPPFILQKQHVDHAIRQLDETLAKNTAGLVLTAEKRKQ